MSRSVSVSLTVTIDDVPDSTSDVEVAAHLEASVPGMPIWFPSEQAATVEAEDWVASLYRPVSHVNAVAVTLVETLAPVDVPNITAPQSE